MIFLDGGQGSPVVKNEKNLGFHIFLGFLCTVMMQFCFYLSNEQVTFKVVVM